MGLYIKQDYPDISGGAEQVCTSGSTDHVLSDISCSLIALMHPHCSLKAICHLIECAWLALHIFIGATQCF